MIRPSSLIVLALALMACGGTSVGVIKMGIRPPKPASCELKIVTVRPEDMAPGAAYGPNGEYEMIGALAVTGASGTDMMSEEVRQAVRPKACEMGGDVLSMLSSATYVANKWGAKRESMNFNVWAKRPSTAAAPEKF
ncbi:MAG: hypothetical protein ABI193_22125 [Minicystis sp.]